MKIVLLITLMILISSQDPYDQLINEKVSEDYCKQVITNMIAILKEDYIYLDFLKSPKQPEGYEDYIPQVDLIAELEAISTKDRTFLLFIEM